MKLNKLQDRIEVVCAAAGLEEGSTHICWRTRYSGASVAAEECPDGILVKVPVKPVPKADVAKIDCEGCEYNIIMNINEPLWSEIGMEYHDRPEPLIERLNSLGYQVNVVKKVTQRLGIIHATLKA